MAYDVAVLVGSLRKESLNRKVAKAIATLAPEGLAFEIVEIGDLPLYNEDLERDGPPESWTAFRERIKRADALLFLTPEYNRSVPGVLKNACDVASRPWGQNAFDDKPGAVVGVSPGGLGAFGAANHLRQILAAQNVALLSKPETYLGGAGGFFNEEGALVNESTQRFLESFIAAFAAWVERLSARRA